MAPAPAPLGRPVPDWRPPPRPGPRVLAHRLVRLDPLDPARHAAPLFAALSEGGPSLWDYMGYGPFADAAAFGDWAARMAGQEDPLFYALTAAGAAGPGGCLALLRIAPEAGSLEIGHILLGPALRRGPALTAAMALLLGWAFGAGYRRVEWKCDALNRPSRAAARRFGLSYEGTFRQAMVVKGRNRDTAWFAATDGDWARLAPLYDRWLSPDNFDAEGRQRLRLSELTAPVLAARDPLWD